METQAVSPKVTTEPIWTIDIKHSCTKRLSTHMHTPLMVLLMIYVTRAEVCAIWAVHYVSAGWWTARRIAFQRILVWQKPSRLISNSASLIYQTYKNDTCPSVRPAVCVSCRIRVLETKCVRTPRVLLDTFAPGRHK